MIDGHSHLLMSSSEREKRRVADLTEVDLEVLFAGLDRLGIERVVSLVQDTTRIWRGWTGTNDLAIDLQAKFPDRFMTVFGGEPLDRENRLNRRRLQELERAARDHDVKGWFYGPPYSHIRANDRRVYPFYEVAMANDVVVYFHHGGGIGGGGGEPYRAPLKYARPLLLDDVVIDFPELRIHVEHMAYPWGEELFALMKRAPNVYTDVSELFARPTLLAWYLVMAKEYGVIDRVIWGSDYDVYWHDDWDFSGYFGKVRAETTWLRSGVNEVLHRCGWPTLTDNEIGGILGDNVKRLKRIEP